MIYILQYTHKKLFFLMDDTTVSVIFLCFSAESGEFVCQAAEVYQFNSRATIIRPASAAKGLVFT